MSSTNKANTPNAKGEHGNNFPCSIVDETATVASRMKQVLLEELITELNSIPERHFSADIVYDCLKTHPVVTRSLQPYLFFDPAHLTRNLVFKNDLFEIIILGWETGQSSPIQSFPREN